MSHGKSVEPDDAELVRQVRTGDSEVYGELVTRYQGHVYGLAYSLVNHWADAQDIAQEAFIRAYCNLDQLRDPNRFAAWLRRVTFSVAMNWLKAFRPGLFKHLGDKVDLDNLDIPDFKPGPSEVVEKRELAEAVLQAVASLPPKYRVPLTMFHLDGLSYQKVAEFLDIPLGTAKSLIHRARKKLEPVLSAYAAEEITPMVQEVFNEHKLPEEFARKVLENIQEIRYDKWESTLCGSVVACMEFLKEDVPYELVMGVSGSAFKLLWAPNWCPSNNSMGILGPEPVRRTFRALGFEHEIVVKTNSPECEAEFRRKIIDSIELGRPVVAWGIVGAPDEGIIAGYDHGGDVLLGRSYFYDGSKGYYEQADWYEKCRGLLLIGEKAEPPSKAQILRESLEWAVELARKPEWERGDGAKYACGLAAYNVWADALTRDEDFPEGDLKVLTFRCQVSTSVTLSGLRDARKAATEFLKHMADGAAKGDVLAAAAAYEEEGRILEDALKEAPFCFAPEEQRLRMADPKLRAQLAQAVLAAKEKDRQAIERLEQALLKITAD